MHIAVAKGHLEAVQKLAEAGADFRKSKTRRDSAGIGNSFRHEKVVQFLKEEDVRRPVPLQLAFLDVLQAQIFWNKILPRNKEYTGDSSIADKISSTSSSLF